MPEVCRSRSSTVTGRSGGTSVRAGSPSPALEAMPTFTSAKAGMYLDTGSDGESLPSSTSIMAARQVIGLVIECSAKIVCGLIGAPVATS